MKRHLYSTTTVVLATDVVIVTLIFVDPYFLWAGRWVWFSNLSEAGKALADFVFRAPPPAWAQVLSALLFYGMLVAFYAIIWTRALSKRSKCADPRRRLPCLLRSLASGLGIAVFFGAILIEVGFRMAWLPILWGYAFCFPGIVLYGLPPFSKWLQGPPQTLGGAAALFAGLLAQYAAIGVVNWVFHTFLLLATDPWRKEANPDLRPPMVSRAAS